MSTLFVINAAVKYQARLCAAIEQAMEGTEYDLSLTTYPGHATEIARQAAGEGVSKVVAVGGDGTLNECLNGLVGTECALGVIPAGTANDLAAHYNIPADIEKACSVIRTGRLKPANVIRVNDWHYLTMGGIGIPCDAIRAARGNVATGRNRLRETFGSRAYVLGLSKAMICPSRWKHPVTIGYDGGTVDTDAFSLTAGVLPTLGRHFRLLPGAGNGSRLMSVCLIENCPDRAKLLRSVLRTFSGNHVHSANVRTFATVAMTIFSEKPLMFFGDGELIGPRRRYLLRLLPHAIRLIVP